MRRVEKQYDFWARWYDVLWRKYSTRTTIKLLELAEVRPEDRVLDIGCGTGAIERLLLQKNPLQDITGVDLSEKMLAQARRRAPGRHVRYVRAAASDLPMGDHTFDIVLSASVLHYLREPRDALAEMRRVLRSAGHMYVLDWNRDTAAMRMRDAVLRRIDPAHVRSHSAPEAAGMIKQAGFGIVDMQTFTSGTYSFFVAAAQPLE